MSGQAEKDLSVDVFKQSIHDTSLPQDLMVNQRELRLATKKQQRSFNQFDIDRQYFQTTDYQGRLTCEEPPYQAFNPLISLE